MEIQAFCEAQTKPEVQVVLPEYPLPPPGTHESVSIKEGIVDKWGKNMSHIVHSLLSALGLPQ